MGTGADLAPMALERGVPAIVTASTSAVTLLASLRVRRRLRYGVPLVLVLGAVLLIDFLRPVLPGGGVFLLLLIPVMACSVALGVSPGVEALLLGAAGSVLLVVVREHPWLQDPEDVARLALYLAEGLFIIVLAAALRGAVRRRPEGQPRSANGGAALVEPLTSREIDVLRLAASGLSIAQIGHELYLSRNTVKSHLAHAYGKLGAHNRAEAVAAGLLCGCINESALTSRVDQIALGSGTAVAVHRARQRRLT
jgi:DNA-binding CsgD family transcriptional regulator